MATYSDLVVNVATVTGFASVTDITYTVPAGRRAIISFQSSVAVGVPLITIQGISFSAGITRDGLFLDEGDSITFTGAFGNQQNFALTAFEYTNP